MQNTETPITKSVFTGAVALMTLVMFAVLLSETRPANTYESPDSPLVQTRPVEDVFIGIETKEEAATEEKVSPAIAIEKQESEETPLAEPEASQQAVQSQPVVAQSPSLYDTSPMSLEAVNEKALTAIVNVLCGSTPGSSIPGATGSGIFIDPRGVILTNAHVAQYILLQSHPSKPVKCTVRIGAPAKPRYEADVLASPRAWAEEHGKDILVETPTGTGEHDWALLYVTGRTDGSERPATYPFIDFDPRHAVTKTGDSVLLTSYPAGFLGGIAIRKDLWPVSTIVSIQKVYTFTESIIDLLSLGGNIVAQAGSSGGAVLNQWGKLVGMIVTSSLGETTSERDLRAVTLAHIDNSIKEHTGSDLTSFLELGDFETRTEVFKEESAPSLLELFPL